MEKVAKKKKRSSFAVGAMVLAGAGFVSKFLGAIYRIPLTNILGAEGIGMYQLIFPIYALMLTLSSGGVPSAIARLVAERSGVNDEEGAKKVFFSSAVLLTLFGCIAVLSLVLLARPLAALQGNEALRYGYYAIAPAILIVAGSAYFKGWFQGNLDMMPSAYTQLIEQGVKMGAGLFLSAYLMRYGIIYAVVGAILGITVSELISFIVMFVIYIRKGNSLKIPFDIGLKENMTDILKVALPITLSGLVFPLVQFIDSVLIVNALTFFGVEKSRSTALYGLLTGPVNSLVNMPVVLTLALSVAIVPVVSVNRIKRDADAVKEKCNTALKLSYMLGVPSFLGIFVLAELIMKILYPTLSLEDITIATTLLRVSSVSILFLSEVQIYTSLLQALDKTKIGIISLSVAALLKVILVVALVGYLGILGAAVASVASYLMIATFDKIYMRKYLGKDDPLVKDVSKILVSGLTMTFFVYISARFIPNIYVSLIVSILIGVAIYLVCMVLFKVMNDKELESVPFGKLLRYVGKKIRFWEK